MGNCFSSKAHSSGHTVLGSSSAVQSSDNSQTVADRRARAAQAAEQRQEAAATRGGAGKLSQQLAASKSKAWSEPRQEERPIVMNSGTRPCIVLDQLSFFMPTEWDKVLWKRQLDYSDNYIPKESFLSSLRKNANFTPYTYWRLVLLSGAISQHLATIFIFIAVFVRLKERSLDPRLLLWISVGCFLVGYAIWEVLDCAIRDRTGQRAERFKKMKSSILTFLALMSLSPVLRTLTAATSSDSIWALSAVLFVLNGLLADYSTVSAEGIVHERLTSVLSMNAAISSSVVLASRLSNDLAVFALVLFSVQAFALFPMLRRRLQALPIIVQLTMTALLFALSLILTAPLSLTVTSLYGVSLLFVSFLAPAVVVWAQKYKNEIRGPWDVAVPKVKPN